MGPLNSCLSRNIAEQQKKTPYYFSLFCFLIFRLLYRLFTFPSSLSVSFLLVNVFLRVLSYPCCKPNQISGSNTKVIFFAFLTLFSFLLFPELLLSVSPFQRSSLDVLCASTFAFSSLPSVILHISVSNFLSFLGLCSASNTVLLSLTIHGINHLEYRNSCFLSPGPNHTPLLLFFLSFSSFRVVESWGPRQTFVSGPPALLPSPLRSCNSKYQVVVSVFELSSPVGYHIPSNQVNKNCF